MPTSRGSSHLERRAFCGNFLPPSKMPTFRLHYHLTPISILHMYAESLVTLPRCSGELIGTLTFGVGTWRRGLVCKIRSKPRKTGWESWRGKGLASTKKNLASAKVARLSTSTDARRSYIHPYIQKYCCTCTSRALAHIL